jgi:hypothetical protein
LACCDLSFLTSDALLGFDDVVDSDVRYPYLNALLHDLIRALSTTDFIKIVTGASPAQSFGIGPLPPQGAGYKTASEEIERQRHDISYEFSNSLGLPFVFAPANGSNLLFRHERIALWPLESQAGSVT